MESKNTDKMASAKKIDYKGFIAPSINITELDPELPKVNIVTKMIETNLTSVMSNSFGFGGTNGSVIFTKVE